MGHSTRLWKTISNYFCKWCKTKSHHRPKTPKSQQYRIAPKSEKLFTISVGNMERFITRFTVWSYKTLYIKILFLLTLFYFLCILLFAIVLFYVNESYFKIYGKQCVVYWNYDIIKRDVNFEYMFDLSWTTFSTVGYGVFSPSTESHCWGIRIICALEAFIGIIFSGGAGALLFARIMRIVAHAPVQFSSVMCLGYGSTLNNHSAIFCFDSPPREVFPVLEFRVVNTSDQEEKSILDASVSCNAIITLPKEQLIAEGFITVNKNDNKAANEFSWQEKNRLPFKNCELNIETDKMACFDGVWYVRHYLDSSSPLLKENVKQEIRDTGKWPSHLNDYESIRNSMSNFREIVVLITGVQEITASSVSAVTKYKKEDIYIGWKFAGLLYGTGHIGENVDIKVDENLIHDIVPQHDGDNEPIFDV